MHVFFLWLIFEPSHDCWMAASLRQLQAKRERPGCGVTDKAPLEIDLARLPSNAVVFCLSHSVGIRPL
jgi:hypothetical protein